MSQGLKIGLAAVAVLVVFGAVGLWSRSNNQNVSQIKATPSDTAGANLAALNPVNGQVVGENMAETNPFKVEINPYAAYKNPFKQ